MSTATTHINKEKELVPALRFKEFDGHFQLKEFDEITDITRLAGYEYSKYWKEDEEQEIIALRGYNIGRGELVLRDLGYISNALSMQLIRSRLSIGDIVYPCVGSIGNAVVIEENDKFHIQQNIAKITCNEFASPYYVVHFLTSDYGMREVYRFNASGAQPNVLVGSLRKYRINIPSLPEQQKIASFLSAVDEKIQQLTKKKALLEQYKKGLMQQLFSGQLRFKNENGNPYPNWEEKRLGEVFGVIRGKGISKDQLNDNGETKCILYGQLYTTYNEVVFNVVSRTDTNEGVLSIKGDLLVPSSTTTTGIDLANVTALNEEGVLLGGDISILRSKLDANNVFYAYYLSNHKKYEIAAFAQGSTIVHLSYNHFKVMRIDIPVIEEQQKIATYLSRIDTKIEAVNNQITQTQTFKKGLLQQMFV
jgi:type I restriction enzyme S subunit